MIEMKTWLVPLALMVTAVLAFGSSIFLNTLYIAGLGLIPASISGFMTLIGYRSRRSAEQEITDKHEDLVSAFRDLCQFE